MSLRVLVCGDRHYEHDWLIHAILDGLYEENTVGHLTVEMSEFVLIEGCATGADAAAHWWGEQSPMHSHNEHPDHPKFTHMHFPADWKVYHYTPIVHVGYRKDGTPYNKAAGPERNQRMLDEGKPELVLAFSDDFNKSRGTMDMITRADKAGVPVFKTSKQPQEPDLLKGIL